METQSETAKIVTLEQRVAHLEQRLDILVRRVNNMSDRLTALETSQMDKRMVDDSS